MHIAGLFKVCWFSCKWGVMLAVLAIVAVGVYITTRLNDDIRRHVEQTLSDHYRERGLRVTVEGAKRIEGEGIRVRGISIVDPSLDAAQAELARLDELFVITDADLISLVQGKATAREIVVRRSTLRTTIDNEGNVSAGKLLPLPKFSDRAVPLRVEQAQVELFDARDASRPPWKLHDISFRFARRHVATEKAESSENTNSATDERHVHGALVCDHIGKIEFDGLYEPNSGHWQLKGGADDVRLSRALCDSLPHCASEKTGPLEHLRGHAHITFEAAKDAKASLGATFAVHADLKDGQITDPRLPYPLSDVRLVADANNEGVILRQFSGRHGQTTLEVTGSMQGVTPGSPATLSAKIRNLNLERWEALSGTPLDKLWSQYQPSGQIDVDADLKFDGTTWHPNALVTCQNVGFKFHKFPYPLTHARGTLHLVGKDLKIGLTAHSGSQPIAIAGQFQNVGPQVTGRVNIKGSRLPVDSKLLAALPPAGADVIRRLRGSGHFGFVADLWRDRPTDPVHHQYKIQLEQCAIKFDRFPYPLRNVTGKIDVVDGHWTFYDLESIDQRRHVSGWGNKKRPDAGGLLTLQFIATDVPLDSQLRSALDDSMKELWDQLNPRGSLDKVKVDVTHTPAQEMADLVVRVEKDVRGGFRRIAGSRAPTESVTITPEFFPYRFDKVSGAATYVSKQRRVTLRNYARNTKARGSSAAATATLARTAVGRSVCSTHPSIGSKSTTTSPGASQRHARRTDRLEAYWTLKSAWRLPDVASSSPGAARSNVGSGSRHTPQQPDGWRSTARECQWRCSLHRSIARRRIPKPRRTCARRPNL